MLRSTKDIERLISRRLDGALSPEEELQLDRELIRNPEARLLMEDYRRIDGLACAALGAAFSEEAAPIDLDDLSVVRRVRSGHARVRWLVAGAIAAATAAVFVARTSFEPVTTTPTLVDRHPAGTVGDGETRRAVPEWRLRPKPIDGGKFMRNASMPLPARVQRHRGRETIGIFGEDGNIYWIEVNRSRTVRKASPQVVRQWATGGV